MRISVIMPSYNQAGFLRQSLDSLASQDHPDVEVRIYDGGSTDGSADILRSHPARFSWVSEPDGGQAAAINRGLMESSGEILGYLNSDDVYCPGALAAVARHFESHPECMAVYGDANHLNADGSVMEPYPTEPWDYARLQEVCYLCQPAVFWRREVVERFGLFDDSLHYALDYEYWLRVGKRVPFHHLKGSVLAGSRLHPGTKTLSQKVGVHREILSVILRHGGSTRAVQRWLQHLAHCEAAELASPDASNPDERKLYIPFFAAAVLKNAGRFNLRLEPDLLRELYTHMLNAGC
jgi:glycosyltransferase involved in cell wall biosynthesis